jgi:hypothetical protein
VRTKSAAAKGLPKKPDDKTRLVDVNFKMPLEFRQRMAIYAIQHNMSMKQVLEQAFTLLENSRKP